MIRTPTEGTKAVSRPLADADVDEGVHRGDEAPHEAPHEAAAADSAVDSAAAKKAKTDSARRWIRVSAKGISKGLRPSARVVPPAEEVHEACRVGAATAGGAEGPDVDDPIRDSMRSFVFCSIRCS